MDKHTNESPAVYKLLGELSADMKHVLRALSDNKTETNNLRKEIKELDTRLDKVEKFNTKVLTYATIAAPVLLAVVKWGVPFFLSFI